MEGIFIKNICFADSLPGRVWERRFRGGNRLTRGEKENARRLRPGLGMHCVMPRTHGGCGHGLFLFNKSKSAAVSAPTKLANLFENAKFFGCFYELFYKEVGFLNLLYARKTGCIETGWGSWVSRARFLMVVFENMGDA